MSETPTRTLDKKTISPIICVMFDDVWETDYTVAYPSMAERGIRGTSDITISFVGTTGHMTNAQIQTLASDGWDFQDHSNLHHGFTGLTESQIILELEAVDNYFITQDLPEPLAFVAPAASINDDVRKIISDYGRSAIMRPNGNSIIHDKRHSLLTPGFTYIAPWRGKYNLTSAAGLQVFKDLIDQTVTQRNILFTIFHKIVNNDSPIDPLEVPNTMFEAFLDYGLSEGVTFMTFTQVYNYITNYQELI